MTPINVDVVTRLIAEMEQAVSKLRSLSVLSQDKFLADSNFFDAAKYNLIVAVEALIDLCNHINALERLGKPEEYADVLRIIGAGLFLDADFIIRLEKMAKFRNLIVHLYWKVDNAEVYNILKNNLDDFDLIKSQIPIKHDLVASDQVDLPLNYLNGNKLFHSPSLKASALILSIL